MQTIEPPDQRVLFLVMLNATEESPLYEILSDIESRGFFDNSAKTLNQILAAVRFLLSGGWAGVGYETRSPHTSFQELPIDAGELIVASMSSWEPPTSDDTWASYCLFPTPLGVQAWSDGFTIVQLDQDARQRLMFPQYSNKGK